MLRIVDRGNRQRNVVAILPDTPVQSNGSYRKKWRVPERRRMAGCGAMATTYFIDQRQDTKLCFANKAVVANQDGEIYLK